MTQFAFAPDTAWLLDASVERERRERLIRPPPFEDLVEALMSRGIIERVKLERAPANQPGHRCVAVLRVAPDALDVFFNAASGYRAQYFSDPNLGQKSNCYVAEKIIPKVLDAIKNGATNKSRTALLEASLRHDWLKVWIHQGTWLRHARKEDRVLRVPQWQSELTSSNKDHRKLAHWGSLAPACESRLVFKGGYVLGSNKLMIGKPSSVRALELHKTGFT